MASQALTAEDYAFSRLISYAAYQWPNYRDAHHHRLIARHLEAVERGDIKRLMITMPPRHGKSMLASEYFPAWYLGRNPDHYVVAATYAQDLADDFGRKVRNQINDPLYQSIFPGVGLKTDSSSSRRFHVTQPQDAITTGQNGAYFAVGVGGPLTGRGAHLLLIDDPIKNREDAESEVMRRKIKDWYTSTAYTRLMPGGRIVVIQCMTGDTPVLMADGLERSLDSVRPGDMVASYRDGELIAAKVLNWASQGIDTVYEMKMSSGITVKANERHPFLVIRDGLMAWTRLKNIRAQDQILRVIGANGGELSAQKKDAQSQQEARGFATPIMDERGGLTDIGHRLQRAALDKTSSYATGMGSALMNMKPCSPSKAEYAPFASEQHAKAPPIIGETPSASITTTTPERLGACSATTATLSLVGADAQRPLGEHLNTSSMTSDTVLSILWCGHEEVFDIQVDGTENFIANGLVSHNTRWHEDDLSGWLQSEHAHENWTVLDLPAISDDGAALWPEQYPIEALEGIKRALPPRDWSALYQQRPSPDTGDYFKRDWIYQVDHIPPIEQMMVYGGSDYAVTSNGGDYTVHAVVGVDHEGRMYLLDLWRRQASSDVWVDAFCDLVRKWKPIGWAEETGQIKSGVGPFLIKRMLETGSYTAREQFATRGDKAVRAQSMRGRMALQGLHVHRDAPWLSDLISEMMAFPVGVHDDQVDALGLVGQLMDRMSLGDAPKKKMTGGYFSGNVTADGVIAPPLPMLAG